MQRAESHLTLPSVFNLFLPFYIRKKGKALNPLHPLPPPPFFLYYSFNGMPKVCQRQLPYNLGARQWRCLLLALEPLCLLVLGCVAPSSYLLPVSRRHPVALKTWHFAGLSDTQQHTEASLIETVEPKHRPFERIRYLLISKQENLGTSCDVSSVDWYYEENFFFCILHFAKPVASPRDFPFPQADYLTSVV